MDHNAETAREAFEAHKEDAGGSAKKEMAAEKKKPIVFLILAAVFLLGGLWIGYDRGRYHPPEPSPIRQSREYGYIQGVEELDAGDTLVHFVWLGGRELTFRLLPDTVVMIKPDVDLKAIPQDQPVMVDHISYSDSEICEVFMLTFVTWWEDLHP